VYGIAGTLRETLRRGDPKDCLKEKKRKKHGDLSCCKSLFYKRKKKREKDLSVGVNQYY